MTTPTTNPTVPLGPFPLVLESWMNASNENFPLISIKNAAAMTSLSRTAINALRGAGMFPAAVQLGERRIAFVRAEVEAWIELKIAQRAA